MFLVNREGRITDLPARMEEEGFNQALEILSISSSLMEGIPSGVSMSDVDVQRLRARVLAEYPNVITDEEYLEQHPRQAPQAPVVDSNEQKTEEGIKIVSSDMTKKMILVTAKENGVKLSKQEEGLTKDKLIELVNDRSKR
jgi:hypothetical protein